MSPRELVSSVVGLAADLEYGSINSGSTWLLVPKEGQQTGE
jgi:hypothetical protein